MHHDAGLGQALHDRQDLAAHARLAEKAVAELRIRGVDGHVERREALLFDSPELSVVEVGQGDVVAVEEREPEVVVLDIEAPAHPAGQLVDEAEYALVAAGVDLARVGRLELEAQVGPRPLQDRAPAPSSALDGQAEPR